MVYPDKNIVGKSRSREIMKTDDWAAAKTKSDFEASDRIIGQLWNEKKTDQLKNVFADPEKVIFISQPSTSRLNVLSSQFAEKLASKFKVDFVLGDFHARASHSEMSKDISFTKRAFHPRKYKLVKTDILKEIIGDKEVCLVEDVITSGGSVASFTKALNREGIEVKSIAALTGERRLNIDEKTHDRLYQALKAKSININTQELTTFLTRMEAGGIIMTANSAKSEIAIEKLQADLRDRVKREQNMEYPDQLKESQNSNTISEVVSKWRPGQILEENSNPEAVKEVPEQEFIKEKENPKELESRQLGHDHAPEQMKAERDPNLTDISPKVEVDLNLPQINTSYKNAWKQELEESQKLVDQEHSKEMPQEQERHQEQLGQLKQNEQEFEKESEIELRR